MKLFKYSMFIIVMTVTSLSYSNSTTGPSCGEGYCCVVGECQPVNDGCLTLQPDHKAKGEAEAKDGKSNKSNSSIGSENGV